MCDWGTEELVEVTVPARLSSTGVAKRKVVGIDACIAPLVRALDSAGIVMAASCCGHGKKIGRIDLEDGRVLIVGGSMEGTFTCPICGVGTPHGHDRDDVMSWLEAQASRFGYQLELRRRELLVCVCGHHPHEKSRCGFCECGVFAPQERADFPSQAEEDAAWRKRVQQAEQAHMKLQGEIVAVIKGDKLHEDAEDNLHMLAERLNELERACNAEGPDNGWPERAEAARNAAQRIQQAEQERDVLQQKLNIYEIDLSERVAALTERVQQAEQARDEARELLALAAMEINCAGPVHERIRVLKREYSERVQQAEQARDDYREAYEDTKRLARAIDVAMHGEEGAAKQASLCDLVGPARDMRLRVVALTQALKDISEGAEAVLQQAFQPYDFFLSTLVNVIRLKAGEVHAKT